jgi:polar amino acid transport system substrate-binding protein
VIVALRRPRAVGLIVCAAVALGGCATVSEDAQNSSLEALARQPPTPKEYEPPAPKNELSCDRLFDSLPASALPPPGRMPAGSYMETIRKRGALRVGVDQNTLGLGYFNPKDKAMEGLDIDLVREVARAIFGASKDRIVFKAISTAQRPSVIEFDEVDIVASAFSITCERLQNMYFSSVYYRAQQRLLVLEDSTDDSLSDLRGKEVCATKSSTSIKNLEGTGVVSHPVGLRPDCLVELQEGSVAAITGDDSILFGLKQQDRQTKIVGSCINVERYGMAINRRRPEFVRFVNGVLKRLGPAGLERIRRRWLNGLTAPTSDEISRCDRRAARRRAANETAKLRRERRATDLSERWRRQLTAPEAGAILPCERRCARRGSR